MGNCQAEGGKQEMPVFDNYDTKWSEVNRNSEVTINGPIAYVNESEEGGLILFKQPADDNSQAKFQVVCDTLQTIVGFGIVDLDVLEGTDFNGQNKYGLDHGQFMITSEKIVICSNDDKLDKKTIGFEIKQNDIIECVRQGKNFAIKNGQESVSFNLDDNKRYHFAVYLIGGWNANDGVCSPAAVKIVD